MFNITFTILIGCSKKFEITNSSQEKIAKVAINIAGISETTILKPSNIKGSSSSSSKPTNKHYNNAFAETYHKNNSGLTLDALAEQVAINSSNISTNKNNTLQNLKDNKKNIAAVSPMTPGFTYRILIYTNDSPELWKTFQIIAGSPINIEVTDGVTYKWFVYSYNNNETLPVPTDTQNPTVEAPITKDLLFASGQLTIPPTPPGENPIYPLDIVFNHKMAKISVKIDANILADYATVNGLKVVFSDNDYIKNGVFNIKNNVMDSYNIVPVTEIINSAASNPTNTWNVTYYTADPESLASYSIKITDLPVTFTGVDPSIANVNLATFSSAITPIPNIEATFNFITPTAGQELIGTLNLSYTLSSRRILHVSNTTSFGYSFQKGPSWNMINALENFGNLPNSLVRMQPYATGQGVWIGGTASGDDGTNFLTALATTAQSNAIMARINSTDPNIRPDIVILAYDHWFMTSALQDALVSYINDGGVCIMMNEFTDINSPQSFLNKLFVLPANTVTLEPLGPAGTMYRLLNVDDRVLNGPFGDARQKLWGEDASTSVGAQNLPLDQVVIYSYGQGVNRATNVIDAQAVSMFRHKTKNFFYLGDGGLISYDGGVSATICPFDYNPVTKRPIPKLFGYAGNGYGVRSDYAYNGIIAGNIMLWAGELSEFKGIKRWKYRPD